MNADPDRGCWRTGTHASNGFQQFWREWRPREGQYLPVLALHGSLTQSGMWIAPAEAARSIHMLCPDQRGFGLSEDSGSDSCAEFAADTQALARSLLRKRYVLMAHSFACSIALEAAHIDAAQVAAVVLIDPVVRAGAPPAAPAAPSDALPKIFAAFEDAERHFRATEEGERPNDGLRQFVRDIMMRDGETGGGAFPLRRRGCAGCARSPHLPQAITTCSPRLRWCAVRCWCSAVA
ncbi:MAG TPA: alpha/beta hydrolase [Pseudolabrys sp.]